MNEPILPLGLPGARALVVGNRTHIKGSVLPDVDAVEATVHDIGQELVTRGGLDPAQLRTLIDPRDPVAFGEAVTSVAESAQSVLLVYYVGHGLVGLDGELHLATHITDHLTRGLAYKAFPYSALRAGLAASSARSTVLVLDCCFSGRANATFGAVADFFDTAYAQGGFVLASAAPEELALAPPEEPYTTFSGELLRLLREGDPGGPPHLTWDHAYRYLSRTLRSKGFPQPHRQSRDRAGELVLAANQAYQPAEEHWRLIRSDDHADRALEICPYQGLASFTVEDACYFFGREQLTAELVARLSARLSEDGPIMAVGPSGAGKSSLLRAGLMPALDRGLPTAPEAWRWPRLVLHPGEHPVDELASGLACVLGQDAECIRAGLMADPRWIVECLGAGQAPGGPRDRARLVLVVDQFEELFTVCAHERQREVFIQAVSAACAHAADAAEPPAVVVLGLRADFYGHCGAYPLLLSALREGQVLVGPMTAGELRDCIEKPAHLAGLNLEPGLVDLLLRDLRAGEPAAHGAGAVLPLLSHALLATWQKRAGRTLTMAGYQAASGIWDAVARTAEDTYHQLDPAEQHAARLVLLRMVHLGEGTEDTRRRVTLAELNGVVDPATAGSAVPAVIDALAQARLITLDNDSAEIIHDAVLRAWPRLNTWIETDRAGLLVRQRLHEAAEAWQRDGRDPGALYRGVRLDAARQWAEESGRTPGIAPVAQVFLEASTAQEHAECRAARRRRTRLRALAAALAVLLVIALGAVGVAVRQSRLAAQQRDRLASQLAGQAADRLRSTDPALALQLALAARHVADTAEARTALHNSALAPYDTLLTGHRDTVGRLVYSPDRHVLASESADHTVRLWDFTDRNKPKAAAVIHNNADRDVALSPDGRLLAAGNTGTAQQLWNITNPNKPVAVATLADTHGCLSFRPDGRVLAALTKDALTLWDLTDPGRPVRTGTLRVGATTVMSCSFSSDGHTLAAAIDPGRGSFVAQLWDVTNPHHPAVAAILPNTHAFAVAFSPRSPLLAIGSIERGTQLWDTTNPAKPVQIAPDSDDSGTVAALAFARDGHTLAVGVSGDSIEGNSINIVDIADPRKTRTISHYPMPTVINSVVFGDDSAAVLSSGHENVIRSWRPALDADLPKAFSFVENWSFTPDSRILVLPADPESRNSQLWRTTGAHDASPAGTLTTASEQSEVIAVDNHTLLEASQGTPARLWDITDPAHPVPTATLSKIDRLPFGDVTTDGGIVASNGDDGLVHLWDVTDPRAPTPLSTVPHSNHPGGAYISDHGHTLLVIDRAGDMRIWDVTDPRRPIQAARISVGGVIAKLFADIGHAPGKRNLLAVDTTSLNPHEIQLWDISDTRHPVHSAVPGLDANDFTISPKGNILAVGTDNTIDLWDISDIHHPVMMASLPTVRQPQLQFSPDGHLLVSTSKSLGVDFTGTTTSELHLWDVTNPHHAIEAGTPTVPGAVNLLDFSPDGTILLVDANISAQSRVRLLDLNIDSLTQRLCDAMSSTLTPSQWQQYFLGTPYNPPCG